MTTQKGIDTVRGILTRRYPDYYDKEPGERVLLAMSVLCNDLRVREQGGNNHGDWVEAIIGSAGLNPEGGYAWCACAVEFSCDVARVDIGPKDASSAAVRNWKSWAGNQRHRLSKIPKRGRLCLRLNPDGTGHMGAVADVKSDGRQRTYEGNTSSGAKGSQRDGDGMYERIRPVGYFTHFIDLN